MLLSLAALVSSASADPMADFASSLTDAPALVGGCSSPGILADMELVKMAQEMNPNSDYEVFNQWMNPEGAAELGVDYDAPYLFAMGSAGTGLRMTMSVGVSDSAKFTSSVSSALSASGASAQGERWSLSDGSQVVFKAAGDRGVVVLDTAAIPIPISLNGRPGALEAVLAARVDEPGCTFAMDLGAIAGMAPGPRGAELAESGLFFQSFQQRPETFRIVMSGIDASSDFNPTWSAPTRAPVGMGENQPAIVVHINGDLESLLTAAETMGGRSAGAREAVDSLFTEIDQAGVTLGSGIEIGVSDLEGAMPNFVAAVPIKKPWRAKVLPKKIAKRMLKDGEVVSFDGKVVQIPHDELGEIYIGATRKHLVVGTTDAGVRDVAEQRGTPWVQGEYAEVAARPGISLIVSTDQEIMQAAMAAQGQDISDLEAVAMSLRIDGPMWDVYAYMPGISSMIQKSMEDSMGRFGALAGLGGGADTSSLYGSIEDPVGDPPSTEAQSVLMLISVKQTEAKAGTGRFVPYSGGPRELDGLDSQRVDWEGIPEIGVAGMSTACRYEVELSGASFVARAICDEDGDGQQAITIVTEGGIPTRVTPPGVR